MFTKKPEPMKRNPHVSKEDRRFPLLFAKGNHGKSLFIPFLLTNPTFSKSKSTFFCMGIQHVLWEDIYEGKKWKDQKIKLKKHGV